MDWLFLTALSIAFRSSYGVMTKILSEKMKASVYTQAAMLPLAGATVSLLLSPFLGGIHLDFSQINLIFVALIIFGQGLGNITYFESIKNLTSGTAQIAFSSILIFNTLLALLFLNLHLSFINIFGIILLMLAILSVINGKIEFHKKGVVLMILSAFLFSVF